MRFSSLHASMLLLALLLQVLEAWAAGAQGVTVELRSPLSTLVAVDAPADSGSGTAIVSAELSVPSDAPSDLGVGAFIVDRHGRWRQSLRGGRLGPGSHHVRVRIDGDGDGDGDDGSAPGRSDRTPRAGIFFWSGSASRALIVVDQTSLVRLPAGDASVGRLLDLRIDGVEADRACARARSDGAWEVSAKPARAGNAFAMALALTDGQGATIEIPARRQDDGRWRMRFHPMRGGSWKVELLARWTDAGAVVRQLLPPLEVSGPSGDPFPNARTLVLAAPLDSSLALNVAAGGVAAEAEDFAGVDLRVAVPDDAPPDLCIGLVLLAPDGSAMPAPRPVALECGVDQVHLEVPACAPASARVVFWTASDSRAVLKLSPPHVLRSARRAIARRALYDARIEVDAGSPTAPEVGACLVFSARPVPMETAGTLTATASTRGSPPVGLRARALDDRTRRAVGFHPFETGACELRTRMTWSDGATLESALPALNVVGGSEADHATAVQVGAPMPTLLPIRGVEGPLIVTATVIVPDDAPADLGAGVYACDRHGRWYQHLLPGVLDPGIHRLRIDVGAGGSLVGVAHQGRWSAAEAAKTGKVGLMLWTADPRRARVLVSGLAASTPPVARVPALALYDVHIDEGAGGVAAGERWALSLSPSTMPENPYDPRQFSLELVVGTPDGKELRIPGYYFQPMRSRDRGDHEELVPSGAGRFAVRYRPSLPGSHRLRLVASSPRGGTVSCQLDPLTVSGRAWDGMVRVDAADPRFFSIGSIGSVGSTGGAGREPFWPLGPNLRSVWDLRSQDRMRTRVTPDRGTLAYHAYIERYAAAGANAIEVWLAPWNLGLEWRADWPTFHGQGRYNEDNAWRLERVLDDAWAHRMRVNLVINNHGQGSDSCDAEWQNSPYNRANGGRLNAAAQVFLDPWALDGQERMRRYLVARYADHPAIMAWKLWSEMDLTAGAQTGRLPEWHARAIERWRALDVYGHPITSHWCGDYTHADPAILAMPGFSFACIDAYHGYEPDGHCGLLADLLRASVQDPQRGLARFRKPVLVTEFGGDWSGTPNDDAMLTEHLTGPWAALVSGHGGAPMLWWFEWVDQGARWQPYRALSRFLVHEDLRGGNPCAVGVSGDAPSWWCGGWREQDGTVLGYVLERRWGTGARRSGATGHVSVSFPRPTGGRADDGPSRLEWWDPEGGQVLSTQRLTAGTGSITVDSPAFSGHIAFKVLAAGRAK